jgi:polyribonucleotide nucleotidyltransferase
MSIERITCQVGTQEMIIETGKMAKLADGAVTVQVADTIVLVTAVSSTKIKEGQDFFPLSVEYKEKAAAAGRFPGGYFKREGRPPKRNPHLPDDGPSPASAFPEGLPLRHPGRRLLLSADGENDSDILSINGASAALCVSDIPFAGPIGLSASAALTVSSSSIRPTMSVPRAISTSFTSVSVTRSS